MWSLLFDLLLLFVLLLLSLLLSLDGFVFVVDADFRPD